MREKCVMCLCLRGGGVWCMSLGSASFFLFLFHSTTPAHTSPLSFALVPSPLSPSLRHGYAQSCTPAIPITIPSFALSSPVCPSVSLSHYLPRSRHRGAALAFDSITLPHLPSPLFSAASFFFSTPFPSISHPPSSSFSFIASLARVFCVWVSIRASSSQFHCSQSLLDQ